MQEILQPTISWRKSHAWLNCKPKFFTFIDFKGFLLEDPN